MLDKPKKVQRVQRADEPRLHVHPPLFILLVHVTVTLPPTTMASQATPLALDNLRKRLVPIVHVDHPSCFEVSPEKDARVWKFPYGQALGRWVIVRRGNGKESVRLEKRRHDGGARSGIEHLWQSAQRVL